MKAFASRLTSRLPCMTAFTPDAGNTLTTSREWTGRFENLEKMRMQDKVKGKRGWERPSWRYKDTVKDYAGLGVMETERLAKNRDAWRLMTVATSGSAVECRTRNRENPVSNPPFSTVSKFGHFRSLHDAPVHSTAQMSSWL